MEQNKNKKVIFLDRDGTIIKNIHYLNDASKVAYLPHTFEGMQKLRDAGFEFVVVTNQSGVVRKLVTLEQLQEIHNRIEQDLKKQGISILEFYFAPFKGEHPMRKPNPGMLLEASKQHSIDLSESWIFGDRLVDVEAGRRACLKGSIQLTTTNYVEMDAYLNKAEIQAAHMLEAAHIVLKS